MKNKIKILLINLALAGLLFTSCKKDYTCTCDYTRTMSSSSFYQEEKGTTITNIGDVNKQHANQTCTSTYEEGTSGSGSSAVTTTYLKNCNLSQRPR